MAMATRRTSPPGTIILSFLGFLAATVATIAGAVFLAGARSELAEELRKRGTSLSDAQIDAAVTLAQTIGIAVAAVVVLGYLWLAFKLKAGRNWARVVLTVLTLLHVGSLFVGHTADTLSYASCVVAVFAVVVSYLPASNAYIDEVKHAG